MACINGSKLTPATRATVLKAYGYRWTVENETRARAWYARGGQATPLVPLETDSEWLAGHAFHVTRDGSLDARRRHAEPACLADDWRPEPAPEEGQEPPKPWLYTVEEWEQLGERRYTAQAPALGAWPSHSNYHLLAVYHAIQAGEAIEERVLDSYMGTARSNLATFMERRQKAETT